MPEGDSVLQLSERLQWITGRTVTKTDLRVPRYATESFTGEEIYEVWPYGKNLYMRIGERVLHTHLRMEGRWSRGGEWAHTARVVLGLGDVTIVGHELGLVRVFPYGDYPEHIKQFGPDILGDWDREEAARRLLQQPDRILGEALLDQSNVAGIGNEYRTEMMFLLGWKPTVTVGDVGEQGVLKALDLGRRVMWANRFEPRRVFTGNRRQPNFVFGRENQPCRRCGSRIEKAEMDRIVWWCPQCQREVSV